jgi:hypothetical protein
MLEKVSTVGALRAPGAACAVASVQDGASFRSGPCRLRRRHHNSRLAPREFPAAYDKLLTFAADVEPTIVLDIAIELGALPIEQLTAILGKRTDELSARARKHAASDAARSAMALTRPTWTFKTAASVGGRSQSALVRCPESLGATRDTKPLLPTFYRLALSSMLSPNVKVICPTNATGSH